jgi:hypothetical protein
VAYLAGTGRALVSFTTTDAASGMDHYEVGAVDAAAPAGEAPVFVQAASPYQLADSASDVRVTVRAFDRAGNVRDETVDVRAPFLPLEFLGDHATAVLAVMLALVTLAFLAHYFFGHHIVRHAKRILEIIKREERNPEP